MSDFEVKLKTIADPKTFLTSVKALEKAIPPVNVKINAKVLGDLPSVAESLGPLSTEIANTKEFLAGLNMEGTLSDDMFKKLSTDVANVEKQMSKGNITFDEGTKSLDKIKNSAKGTSSGLKAMGKELLSAAGKFTAWYLIAGVVTGVIGLLKDMVKSVVELDSALVDLNKVFDGTKAELEEVTDRAYKAANALATTGTEVIKSITNFKRMGYTIEEAESLGELAIVMTNISENITSASDAADMLGSIMKGLGVDSDYALSILNRLNEVSNNNAISFDDLSKMVQQSAATMKILGNNIDETIGLLTAGFEVLQNDKVAKGIQTIGLRIAGLNEDMSTAEGLANDVSKALLKYADISVWDETTGQLKNTYQVLSEVADKWEEIGQTGGAQEALLNTLAGKQRADVAAAIINNWQAVEKSMENAANSEGSALRENEKYIDSIEGHSKRLQNTLEDIARKVIDSDLVKGIIDIGNAFAQFVGYVLKYVKLYADITGITAAFKMLENIIVVIGAWFNKLGELLDKVKEKLKPVIDFFNEVAYYVGFGWLRDLIDPSAKLDQQYKDIADTFEEAKKQVSEYDKAINRLKRSLTSQIEVAESELDALKKQNEELEKQQEIQNKLLETQKAQMALEEARRKRTTVFRIGKGFIQGEDTSAVQEAQDSLQNAIDDLTKMKYDYALDRTEDFITQLKEIISNGELMDGWESLFDKFGDLLNTEFASYISSAKQFIDEFKNTMENAGIDVGIESQKTLQKTSLEKQIESLNSLLESTSDNDEKAELKAKIANLQKQYTSIDKNASGTENFRGGLTWVGEKGPEIVRLPKHSEILDNNRSMSLKNIVDSGAVGMARDGTVINLNGNLEFPNVSNGQDARSFIDEIINIGHNAIPRFS